MFFCRRHYLECLFLLSCLLPPPSGFCHCWPAWLGSEVRPEPRSGEREGSKLPGNPEGWGWWRGRPDGGFAGETECQGGAQPWTPQPFPLRPATNLGEASTLRNGKLHCTFFKAFISGLAHLTTSLSIVYSFSNFDYYLSLFPNNLWKTCCELVTCQCFPSGLIWLSNALVLRSR